MSKRSQFKINQRVREGVEGKRRVQVHVLQTLTERLALKVADSLRGLVTEGIRYELDRRGYTSKAQACDQRSVADSESPSPSDAGEWADTHSPVEETPDGEGCPSEKTGEGQA